MSDSPTAHIFILHGDDELALSRAAEEHMPRSGDAGMDDMNITRLDGRQCSLDDLRTAVNAMPFLFAERGVILTHPASLWGNKSAQERFTALLNGAPPSTRLVLVVNDTLERREWKTLKKSHWLRAWVEKSGGRATLRICALPDARAMPDWLVVEARRLGGKLTPDAAAALAAHVDRDSRLASQEIVKLLTYVDYARPVEARDVEVLTAARGSVSIFDMLDALAMGNTAEAMRLLHELMQDEEPQGLFAMITRLFRQLIQTADVLQERGGEGEVMREVGVPEFVARRLINQARRYSLPRLEAIYRRLGEMDDEAKSGGMPLGAALDTFIVELTQK